MNIKTLKTHKITKNDSLFKIIDEYIPELQEESILVITSKIISLCEGSVVKKEDAPSKIDLIHQSADAYLANSHSHLIQITIKNNVLIPSAGIDESNGDGFYILYPKNVIQSACSIWEHLRNRDRIERLGVLITDSHTTPMRKGVIGIGLGWCGFKPLYNYIGKPDCFGVPLRVTMINNLDALAAAAVFCMGEGNEQTPFALMAHVPRIEFLPLPPSEEEIQEITIPIKDDLYAPLLQSVPWIFK